MLMPATSTGTGTAGDATSTDGTAGAGDATSTDGTADAALTLKRQRVFDVQGARAEWRVAEGVLVVFV